MRPKSGRWTKSVGLRCVCHLGASCPALASRTMNSENVDERLRPLQFALVLLAIEFSTGCSSSTANVRALRLYEQQDASPESMRQHIEQMEESLRLISTLLYETPYQPGSDWITELPLDSESEAQTRETLERNPVCEASFVCVYNTHVRSVLSRAGASVSGTRAAVSASAPSGFRSFHDALGHVDPMLGNGAEQLKKLNQRLAKLDQHIAKLRKRIERNPSEPEIIQTVHGVGYRFDG